jgi:hypothetical protein
MRLVELNMFSPLYKDQTLGQLQRDNPLDRHRLQLQLNTICAVTTHHGVLATIHLEVDLRFTRKKTG